MAQQPTVLIMAAGHGTRMRSSLPKVLHPVCGRPMIAWVIAAAREAGADPVLCVTRPDEGVAETLPDGARPVEQREGEGTGAAVLAAAGEVDPQSTLVILSGEDAINYPLYAVGARGCISVVSNVAPRLIADGWDAHAAGDAARARKLHYDSLPLAEALFAEASPIPTKTALAMMGRMAPDIRLPHHPMSEAPKQKLRAVMTSMGLLK